MKRLTPALLLGAFVMVLTFTSCEKSRVLNRLEGDWNVTSYIIDNEEIITSGVTIVMEYDEADDGEGDVTWTLTEDGDREALSGEYEINDDADELEITFRDGTEVFIVDVEIEKIEKDELKFEGFIDGESFIIRADKQD